MRPQFNFDLSVSSHFAFYNGIFNATSNPLELHLHPSSPLPLAAHLALMSCCLLQQGALSVCDKNISTLIRRSRKKKPQEQTIFSMGIHDSQSHAHTVPKVGALGTYIAWKLHACINILSTYTHSAFIKIHFLHLYFIFS